MPPHAIPVDKAKVLSVAILFIQYHKYFIKKLISMLPATVAKVPSSVPNLAPHAHVLYKMFQIHKSKIYSNLLKVCERSNLVGESAIFLAAFGREITMVTRSAIEIFLGQERFL